MMAKKKKFEYAVSDVPLIFTRDEVENHLNNIGEEGWEMVAVQEVGEKWRYIFKKSA